MTLLQPKNQRFAILIDSLLKITWKELKSYYQFESCLPRTLLFKENNCFQRCRLQSCVQLCLSSGFERRWQRMQTIVPAAVQ